MSLLEDECEQRRLLMNEIDSRPTVVNFNANSSNSRPEHSVAPIQKIEDKKTEDEAIRGIKLEELLRKSQEEDLGILEESQCIYRAGVDSQGRPIVIFIGKWFSNSRFDLHKALLYLIKILDPVADKDYVVVYFHTRTSSDNIPSYWWIKHVYNSLTYKYKKNLKSFHIVHPTMWTKFTCWWFTTFMAPAIKNKIHNVHALQELSSEMELKDLNIPMFITEQDMSLHGLRYYKP